MGEVRAEWHDRVDFAEVAEALGIETEDIMAMLPEQIVIFTTDTHDDEKSKLWASKLGRDADGILIAATPTFVSTAATFHEQAKTGIEQKLREAGLEPPEA